MQGIPVLLQALRYFYEEYPNLPVIAAGSLLEFTLRDHMKPRNPFIKPTATIFQSMHTGPHYCDCKKILDYLGQGAGKKIKYSKIDPHSQSRNKPSATKCPMDRWKYGCSRSHSIFASKPNG
ncbi:MAG: hypothetical protein ACLFS1_08485 [Opitutales bacterium]